MEEKSVTPSKDLSDSFRVLLNIVYNLKAAGAPSIKALAWSRALDHTTGELEAKGASNEVVAMLKAIAMEGTEAEEGFRKALSSMDSSLGEAASEIQQGVRDLQDEVGRLKAALHERLSKPDKQPARRRWFQIIMYPAGLLVFVGITAALASQRMAETPTVEISYEIGGIIQGALAGIGALVAGGAYAAKTLSTTEDAKRE
jgi:hypothetical protein